MAHNIEFNPLTQRHSFFAVKEPAWHGLGTVVEDALTSKDAIVKGGLDFDVIKLRNKVSYNNELIETPNAYSTFRTDRSIILGDKLSSTYEIIQNTDVFGFFDEIVGQKEAMFQTAGSINNGATIFVTAKLPEPTVLRKEGKEDVIEKYLLITNSHDGSGAISILFTPIRVVCNNTLDAALSSSKNKLSFKHTTNVRDKLNKAVELMRYTHKMNNNIITIYNQMIKRTIPNYDFEATKYVAQLFLKDHEYNVENQRVYLSNDLSTRKRNQITSVLNYTMSGVGQNDVMTKATPYGLYNGITGYHQNVKTFTSKDKRFENSFIKGDKILANKALNLAMTYIN